MADYRPISLINSITKIITKLLATRSHTNQLVSQAQNAFIKKRYIHDNFLYVQTVIQMLHKKKTAGSIYQIGHLQSFRLCWMVVSVGGANCTGVSALGFSTKWRNSIPQSLEHHLRESLSIEEQLKTSSMQKD
jgi:hypothetical protein